MSDENIRYRHSSGSNGRNGHRPASAGIYCSLWESNPVNIIIKKRFLSHIRFEISIRKIEWLILKSRKKKFFNLIILH
jgi:hypothetical protein